MKHIRVRQDTVMAFDDSSALRISRIGPADQAQVVDAFAPSLQASLRTKVSPIV